MVHEDSLNGLRRYLQSPMKISSLLGCYTWCRFLISRCRFDKLLLSVTVQVKLRLRGFLYRNLKGLKRTEMDRNGHRWTEMDLIRIIWHKWTEMDSDPSERPNFAARKRTSYGREGWQPSAAPANTKSHTGNGQPNDRFFRF